MVMVMCTVRDAKMDMYSRPMFFHTEAAAVRSFNDEVNRSADDNPYNKHPEDYAMYAVGTFDDATGKGVFYDPPKMLIHADQCIMGDKMKISKY